MRTTIEESVIEELVHIGMTKDLRNAKTPTREKIPHADAKCPPYGDCK